jgi:uncharacterized protein YutE (UPF0331/DUF86 family)
MTDEPLLAKRLARIETCVADLRRYAQPERIAEDVKEEAFVERTLQIAIQSALDAAMHIVSDERLGEPDTRQSYFDVLARHGWLAADLAARMKRMVGFRNIVVHGYENIDLAIVKDIVEHKLGDLLDFVAAIRSRLSSAQ